MLPLETAEDQEEATASLAAAKDISVDVPAAAVCIRKSQVWH